MKRTYFGKMIVLCIVIFHFLFREVSFADLQAVRGALNRGSPRRASQSAADGCRGHFIVTTLKLMLNCYKAIVEAQGARR